MNNTPPEVLEKWRDEFIEWMQRKHSVKITFDGDSVSSSPINGRSQGRFVSFVAGVAWEVWKEARQSVRIELPEPYIYANSDGDGFEYIKPDQLKSAIESQGYRAEVKGG